MNEADIAVQRKWDAAINAAALGSKPLNYFEMVSPDFAQQAQQEYAINESAYDKYVNFARKLDEEEFDINGDGTFNFTDDALKSMNEMNDIELADMYDGMSDEQKTMMTFDGINSEDDYVSYVRKKYGEYHAAHSGSAYEFEQFWRGVGKSFVAGVMDTLSLPLSILSIAGAAFTGGFDNPLSKMMGDATKSLHEKTDGQIYVDPDSVAGQVGGYVGTAIEFGAEMMTGTVIGKAVGVAVKGTAKLATKALEKAVISGDAKAIEAATSKLAVRASRIIEKEAPKFVQKGEALSVEHVMKAAGSVAPNVVPKAGVAIAASEGVAEALEHATTIATSRLARKGALNMTNEGARAFAAKFGIKGAEETLDKISSESVAEVAAKIASKGSKMLETGVRAAAKKPKGAIALTKEATAAVSGWVGRAVGVGYRRGKIAARLVEGNANEKFVNHLITKTPFIVRATKKAFGIGADPVTKLFGYKAFSQSVQENQEKGMGGKEALARAIFSMASTNMIWGSLGGHYASKIEAALGKGIVKDATESVVKKGGSIFVSATEAMPKTSKVVGWVFKNSGEALKNVLKMKTDGTLQQVIENAWGEDDRDFISGFINPLKKSVSDNVLDAKSWGKTLLEGYVMHFTSALGVTPIKGYFGARKAIERSAWGTERAQRRMTAFIDENMSKEEVMGGIGADMWQSWKDMTRKSNPEFATAKDDDHEFLDQVIANVIDAGGSLGEKAQFMTYQAMARTYTKEVKLNASAILDDHMEAMKRHNAALKKQMENAGMEFSAPWDANQRAREYFEWQVMNNYNLHAADGELPESAKEAGVNNYQPEHIYVAASIVANEFSDTDWNNMTHSQKTDYYKKTMAKVKKIEKLLGKENFEELTKMRHSDIHHFTKLLAGPNTKMKASVEKLLEFKRLLKWIKEKRPTDRKGDDAEKESINDAWALAIKLGISEEDINNLTAAGAQDTIPIAEEIKDAKQEVYNIKTDEDAEKYVSQFKKESAFVNDSEEQAEFDRILNEKLKDPGSKMTLEQAYRIAKAWSKDYPKTKWTGEVKGAIDAYESLKDSYEAIKELEKVIGLKVDDINFTAALDTYILKGTYNEVSGRRIKDLSNLIKRIKGKPEAWRPGYDFIIEEVFGDKSFDYENQKFFNDIIQRIGERTEYERLNEERLRNERLKELKAANDAMAEEEYARAREFEVKKEALSIPNETKEEYAKEAEAIQVESTALKNQDSSKKTTEEIEKDKAAAVAISEKSQKLETKMNNDKASTDIIKGKFNLKDFGDAAKEKVSSEQYELLQYYFDSWKKHNLTDEQAMRLAIKDSNLSKELKDFFEKCL